MHFMCLDTLRGMILGVPVEEIKELIHEMVEDGRININSLLEGENDEENNERNN